MYRSDLKTRDRGGAIAAVIAIHAGLLLAFLHLSGTMPLPVPESVLRTFDLTDPPPPPQAPPPPQQKPQPKPREKEGGSAPKNIKSEATEVKAPKPRVAPQKPNPVVVAEIPRQGAAPTQGSAPVAGPGTGAGGVGNGTGSGAGGNGPGGGGDNGLAVVRARLATPPLSGRDFPQELLRMWPRGAPLFVRFRIAANGAVLQCIVDRGTGVPAIDGNFCAIARARLRFRPGFNRQGQAVADWVAYGQQPAR